MRPYILAETTWKEIKDREIDLAVLPWGATEAHNLHMPFGTDNFETERIAAEAARLAWERGSRPLVLPVVPYGVNTGQLDIRVNINMNPSTQFAILKDITDVLNRHRISKFLIVNGHGGNDFKQILRELGMLYPEMFLCTCNWFQSVDNTLYFEKGGGHADEMETSLMQFLAPDLVLPLSQSGKGKAKKFKIKALNEKWAWSERKWAKVTSDTGVGDPALASPEKGEKYFRAVTEKVSELMIELAAADLNNLYE